VNGVDRALFRLVNGWPDLWAPLFQTLSEGNKWWPVRIVLAFVLVYCLARRADRMAAATAMAAWPVANALTDVLKATFPSERPSAAVARLVEAGLSVREAVEQVGGIVLRVDALGSMGTASAHSANMAAVATAFALERRPSAWIWSLVALGTGLSRVYVGVHYPSQVLLGWLCGVFVGWLVWATFRAWTRLRASRRPTGAPAGAC
jgi:undecaprenyl-diphosphatase